MLYTHITTDEGAAAENFYQVLWNNPAEFKKVIIHLGDFHAIQELFGIIGKIISNSGFEDILYQADICTSGAIKGVIAGKHYNRSWVVHECFSEALEGLFLESEYEALKFDEGLLDLVTSIKNKDSSLDLMNNSIFTSYFEK